MSKTIEAILAEERATQERLDNEQTFRGFTIAALRKTMSQVENKSDWKGPWTANVLLSEIKFVLAAVEFFHADKAEVIGTYDAQSGTVLMRGNGYQAY